MISAKSWPGAEGSRPRTETAYIPTERASKMMNMHVEFISFDELEPEISWIKGGPGPPAGGRVSRQSGVPCRPGGECFAPLFLNGALPLVEGEGCEALSSRHVGSPGFPPTLMEKMPQRS